VVNDLDCGWWGKQSGRGWFEGAGWIDGSGSGERETKNKTTENVAVVPARR
jgi:hypothetical protein